MRLLENKENDRIRLLHRQEKTLKIRANHIREPLPRLLSLTQVIKHLLRRGLLCLQ